MFRKILLVLLCLALLTVTACAPAAQPVVSPSAEAEATPAPSAETAAAPDESAEPAPTAETGSVDQALLSDVLMQTENFSVLLMQNLMNANTEQNSAFSPLALNAVMAALYAGAKGDTEEEMRLLMGYQTEPGDVVQALTYLISAQDSNAFTLGDSLHLSRRVGFVENYIDQITAPLRIGTYSQDYSDPATYQSVNACAELVTNGKVSSLLDSTVAADTLYLISAFQLSAAFDLPFDPARTQTGTFEGTTGLISVPMMAGDFEADYAEDEYMQMVSLPLAEGKMQLKLILPREGGESQKVLAPLLTPVISLVLFFVAFALLRMLVSLLVTVLGLVNKLPVIGAVNHWLGWGVGGIASLVDIYLVLCVVWALIVITGGNLTMLNDTVMSGSLYYKVFNVFNPFV